MKSICYMCGASATGREHAPPLCLFPEISEIGRDLRRNLITVPSCPEHNSAKSKDDEYLLYVLVACQDANSIGEEHFSTKVIRAIARRPALMDRLLEDASPSFVRDPSDGRWHETIKVTLDEKRFYGVLENIARALHYHRFRSQWYGHVHVVPQFLKRTDETARIVNRASETIRDAATRLLISAPCYGENPDVFFYQVHEERDINVTVMRLVFYGGTIVTVMFVPTADE